MEIESGIKTKIVEKSGRNIEIRKMFETPNSGRIT